MNCPPNETKIKSKCEYTEDWEDKKVHVDIYTIIEIIPEVEIDTKGEIINKIFHKRRASKLLQFYYIYYCVLYKWNWRTILLMELYALHWWIPINFIVRSITRITFSSGFFFEILFYYNFEQKEKKQKNGK